MVDDIIDEEYIYKEGQIIGKHTEKTYGMIEKSKLL